MKHPITGCHASLLFTEWFMDPDLLEGFKNQALAYDLKWVKDHNDARIKALEEEQAKDPNRKPYAVDDDIAIMRINGPTTKYETSFADLMGGTATSTLQKHISAAVADDKVSSILLHFDDCPGGCTDGIFDFADFITETDKKKPVYAHIDDHGTSGAMLLSCRARYVTANQNAMLGSIGTMTRLIDQSKRFEANGIKVIPIVSGKLKGIGIPGTEITPEQIKAYERRVSSLNDLFIKTFAKHRGLTQKDVRDMEADVYVGEKGVRRGLVDQIIGYDQARAMIKERKVPTASRDPQRIISLPTASPSGAVHPVRSRIMLNAQQLQQARQLPLPAGTNVTEENADQVLLQFALDQQAKVTDLQQKLATPASSGLKLVSDTTQASGHVKLLVKEITFAQKEGKVLPEQVNLLQSHLMDGDKMKNGVIVADLNGTPTVMLPADLVMKTVEINKPNGVVQERTGAQPVPREEPGKQNETKVTEDRMKELRAKAGLPEGQPISR